MKTKNAQPLIRKGKEMNIVQIKQLTIDHFKKSVAEKACFCIFNPGGDLFQHPENYNEGIPADCLLIDIQSANVVCTVYDAINPENKAKFNSMVQDEYKLANFLNKMWKMVA